MSMNEYAGRPDLPGYVSIRKAAEMLGISDKRVYEYVETDRLPSTWAADVIMIPEDAVNQFKRKSAGRPRTNNPVWRISSGANRQFITSIFVQIVPEQQAALQQSLERMKKGDDYIFPGTVARYITESETVPGRVEISFVWRDAAMPTQAKQEEVMGVLKEALANVLDWDTAQYSTGRVLMHT